MITNLGKDLPLPVALRLDGFAVVRQTSRTS
jgi:hypothetical protein